MAAFALRLEGRLLPARGAAQRARPFPLRRSYPVLVLPAMGALLHRRAYRVPAGTKTPRGARALWPRAALPLSTPKTRSLLAQFAPDRCRDQLPKCPVMQSHGITLSFHREMADSSRELVGSDITAAVSLESYPRFIKGGFQDYEGLGIKRSTADSKHVPSPRFEVARKQRL